MKVSIVAGDDATIVFTVRDRSENAVSLAGITAAEFVVYEDVLSELEKTLDDGVEINDSPSNITVTLTSEDTAGLTPGKYNFDLRFTDADGNRKSIRDYNYNAGVLEILETVV